MNTEFLNTCFLWDSLISSEPRAGAFFQRDLASLALAWGSYLLINVLQGTGHLPCKVQLSTLLLGPLLAGTEMLLKKAGSLPF